MNDERRQQLLETLTLMVSTAQGLTRLADTMVYADDMRDDVDPELRGHIAIALQHLQMAEAMLHGQDSADDDGTLTMAPLDDDEGE